MFPSPIGELHFSITTHNIEDYWNNLFPSPIGELHFSIKFPYLFFKCLWFVSVPYRGATFLNASVDVAPPKHSEFPSPIGELHFSIVITKKLGVGTLGKGFRPLSGSYISQ